MLLPILTCISTCKATDATQIKAKIPVLRHRQVFELEWPKNDNRYDCIAMIYYNYESICPAVLISENRALTAANPFYELGLGKYEKVSYKGDGQGLITWGAKTDKTVTHGPEVVIRYLYGGHDKSKTSFVKHITFQYFYCEPGRVPFDESNAHAPMHDLATVEFSDPLLNEGERFAFPLSLGDTYGNRHTGIRPEGMLTVTGFGYIDALHVKQDYQLEVTEFTVEEALADCDYYVPRNWGRFICVLNIERFVGVETGSPLLHDGVLLGIGAFALSRGHDEVLVYTDIRQYPELVHGNSYASTTSFGYGYEVSLNKEHAWYDWFVGRRSKSDSNFTSPRLKL